MLFNLQEKSMFPAPSSSIWSQEPWIRSKREYLASCLDLIILFLVRNFDKNKHKNRESSQTKNKRIVKSRNLNDGSSVGLFL